MVKWHDFLLWFVFVVGILFQMKNFQFLCLLNEGTLLLFGKGSPFFAQIFGNLCIVSVGVHCDDLLPLEL